MLENEVGTMTRIHRLSKRWQDESGQSAVLIAMLCGLLIFVIAMTTNIGKLVTEKIAMQNAVDLAVYSGAAVQAGELNKMREHNDNIWTTIDRTRTFLELSDIPLNPLFLDKTKVGPACNIAAPLPGGLGSDPTIPANITIEAAITYINAQSLLLEARNNFGNMKALGAARNTADANYKGTKDLLKPYHNLGKMVRLEQVETDLSYRSWCVGTFGPVPAVYVSGKRVKGWWYKRDQGDVSFVAGIVDAHPNSPYLDVGSKYFASTTCPAGRVTRSTPQNGRCGLSTYAAATPFFGKLGAGTGLGVMGENNTDYSTDYMLPLIMSTRVDRSSLISDAAVKDNKFEDYRVRFVGLNDRKANFVQDGGGGLIGDNPATAGFREKLRH